MDNLKGEKKEGKKRGESGKNKKISRGFMVFSFVLSFFCLFFLSSMFILYASFLDYFFGTDLGFFGTVGVLL